MTRPSTFESLEPRRHLARHGLSATYFDNEDFTGRTVQRTDHNVSFDFGNHARPAKGIKGNSYSIRWSGLVQPGSSEAYTFTVRNNDGVRLWVDGKLLIDAWDTGPRTTRSGTVTLKARRYYDLRLEYFDAVRTAGITLQWSSKSTPLSTVPGKRLFAYDARFGAIGDYGFTNAQARDTAKRVLGWNPDFVITVGDNSYSGDFDEDVGTFYHSLIGDYQGEHGAGAPANRFWPALGNHDWDDEEDYEEFFSALPGNKRYYDFERGGVHFFALDSDTHEDDGVTADSKQGRWLKAALAASTSTYNVVYFHHAPYSSGGHANQEHMRWPFEEWGADVVLAGHDHHYERLLVGGIPYFVNGAGAGTRSIGDPVEGSQFRDNSDSGALLIQANDLAMTFEYELRGVKVIDTYSIRPRRR